MRQRDAEGVQQQARRQAGVQGGFAVGVVTDDGRAGVREVDAQLMAATGERAGFDQREAAATVPDAEARAGALAAAADCHDDAVLAGAQVVGVVPAVGNGAFEAADGEVALVDGLVRGEGGAEGGGGGGVAGEDDDAAGVAVEAVGDVQLAAVAEAAEQAGGGGDEVVALRVDGAVRGQPRRLVHDRQVGVEVEQRRVGKFAHGQKIARRVRRR